MLLTFTRQRYCWSDMYKLLNRSLDDTLLYFKNIRQDHVDFTKSLIPMNYILLVMNNSPLLSIILS